MCAALTACPIPDRGGLLMAVCGTPAGYHAHYKEVQKTGGKVTCEPCREAIAVDSAEKRLDRAAQAAGSFEDAINNEPVVEPGLDVLEDLRSSLRILRAAMRVPKSTRDVAALAKQRAELVEQIAKLEKAQTNNGRVSKIDELARRRSRAS